jgi:hypothetical protein
MKGEIAKYNTHKDCNNETKKKNANKEREGEACVVRTLYPSVSYLRQRGGQRPVEVDAGVEAEAQLPTRGRTKATM